MNYPLKLTRLEDGLTLHIPDPELVKPTYEKLLAINPATPFPFWAKIWPASNAMISYLKSFPELVKDKTVLEIGAGIGTPSFSITSIAKTIIISDHDADAVFLMEQNIKHLGVNNITAACLDWNHFPDNIEADVVLLSDTNYAPGQFEPLLQLIKTYLTKGTRIVISTPQRIIGSPFVESIQEFVKKRNLLTVTEGDQKIDLSIFEL